MKAAKPHGNGRRRRIVLAVGQVWVTRNPRTRSPSRRVVEVQGDRVCYSSGGRVSHWCSRRAFRLWIRLYAAVATRTRRPRSLTLRRVA